MLKTYDSPLQRALNQGYFSQRALRGDRPQYGYPPTKLPDTRGAKPMKIVTCWVAAKR